MTTTDSEMDDYADWKSKRRFPEVMFDQDTLRDLFAMAALISLGDADLSKGDRAKWSFDMADQMMEKR